MPHNQGASSPPSETLNTHCDQEHGLSPTGRIAPKAAQAMPACIVTTTRQSSTSFSTSHHSFAKSPLTTSWSSKSLKILGRPQLSRLSSYVRH